MGAVPSASVALWPRRRTLSASSRCPHHRGWAVAPSPPFALRPLLLLVPCCLDARTDLPLKLQARAEKIHPYEVKVRQLSALLEGHAGVKVTVTRDEVMSSFSTESKNALILGTKRHDATGTGPCLTCSE